VPWKSVIEFDSPKFRLRGKKQTKAIFRRCLGRVFLVSGFDKGLIELEVGAVLGEFSAAQSIWVETRVS
jgi:hypothetical protein